MKKDYGYTDINVDGKRYTMFISEYTRFDVSSLTLCFEGNYEDFGPEAFYTLEIESRFGALVNDSVLCGMQYIEPLLAYITENKEFLAGYLSQKMDDKQIDNILGVAEHGLTKRDMSLNDGQVPTLTDIPMPIHCTAGKRLFILDDIGLYREASLHTTMTIIGDEEVYLTCEQFDLLNGIGHNGRMMFPNGLLVKDIIRDGYSS